jgi:thiol-disulfide isomerase/thioredoxin
VSPAPSDVSDASKIDRYAEGWTGLMDLVRNGHSWSGHERNRFFLNDTKGGFYEASRLAGLDFPDDGRGMAVMDWDQDGDLDLWFRNRTAPRLRLMLNRTVARRGDTSKSLALRLQGTHGNRDGIGAVVELIAERQTGRLVRSVRAGDLFLSQSSKWLHFGLDGTGQIKEAIVQWPGGASEHFTGLAVEGRLLLKEGTGVAEAWIGKTKRMPSVLDLAGVELPVPSDDGMARVILPARVPMPALTYRDPAARVIASQPDGKPRLLMLWSSGCPHCRKELGDLAEAADAIRAAGLEVLALSVDGLKGPADDTSEVYDLIDRLGFPFPWGFIDGESAGRIRQFQNALFDRTPADSVPLTILLDETGRAVALYRGPFALAEVLREWKAIKVADDQQLYHFAPPLSGTWFTNPLAPDQIAAFMARRLVAPR